MTAGSYANSKQLKAILRNPFVSGCGGLALASLVYRWMRTLDYKTAYYEATVDPALCHHRKQKYIFIFWHEYIPYQLYLRGHCNVCMLLSQNRDAEVLSRTARYLGFGTIRGSTNSGGLRALREMLRTGKRQHLTITPDGPRGPRRRMAKGPIYLSSRLQIPLVALGMGYDRPWRLSSWDRFAVPRPHSRARCIMSPPLQIPPDLDGAASERHRRRVEHILTRLTGLAEEWAESGVRRRDEIATSRQARALLPGQPEHVPRAGWGTAREGTRCFTAARHAA